MYHHGGRKSAGTAFRLTAIYPLPGSKDSPMLAPNNQDNQCFAERNGERG
jgi:hypothetical protein